MKDQINIKTRVAKTYDQAFQKSAVDMVLIGGRKIVDVARDLGINKSTLKNWKQKVLKQTLPIEVNGQMRSAVELEKENRLLRKELEYTRMQREILKKAMSILGEEPTGGMR